MADQRKEPRTIVNLSVQTWGTDQSGHPFNQLAKVSNVSYSGALLSGIENKVRPGDLIAVRYGQRQARFRVIWTRDTGTSEKIKVAVQKLSTDACPWKELLPAQPHRDQEAKEVHSTLASKDHQSPYPGTGPCRTCKYANVRRWERYDVDVPVRIIIQGKDKTRVVEGRGTALNEGGMAVTVGAELSIQDEVQVEFTPPYSNGPIRICVVVRNRMGYRYGVEFLSRSEAEKEQHERFRSLLVSVGSSPVTPTEISS